MGVLYLVPNLLGVSAPDAVLPARTLSVARSLSHWIVETPKPARAFLKSLEVTRPIAALNIAEFPKDANTQALDPLLSPCLKGCDVGVLSDAGCPGVADPGAVIVARAHALGIRVCPLVGPSSILLALMASGMNGQTFTFHGYLPVPPAARAEALKTLERQSRAVAHATQVFIETPYRNHALIKTALETLAPQTIFCVAVDLSTDAEWIIRNTVAEWRKATLPNIDKRPAIFLLSA